MRIDKNSFGSIAVVWVAGIILSIISLKFIPIMWLSVTLTAILVGFMLFVTWFFRVPERELNLDPDIITSVADGKVVIIRKVHEPEYLKTECVQISVYMDFFNVHANFWPATGEITYYKYHPGKYALAFLPKASEKNEHSSVGMQTGGRLIFFKQIAGTFARRIVCYAEPGCKEICGTQCGIIKFGSRIDLYLPLDCDIKVKVGDEVKACKTIIATLNNG
ncbi:MAG: phosphatidylserine decarboxylase family protein [Bacteroidales bacterium]